MVAVSLQPDRVSEDPPACQAHESPTVPAQPHLAASRPPSPRPGQALLRIIITVIAAISFFKRVYTLPREALKIK